MSRKDTVRDDAYVGSVIGNILPDLNCLWDGLVVFSILLLAYGIITEVQTG